MALGGSTNDTFDTTLVDDELTCSTDVYIHTAHCVCPSVHLTAKH